MSRRTWILVLALAAATAALAGCRKQHLGDGYGRAYRTAFHAQEVNQTAQAPAPQDAHDAKRVLGVHRGGGKKRGPAGAVGGFQLEPLSLGGGQ
jgi:hypothetical protein